MQIIWLLLIATSFGKLITNTITLTPENNWKYITKFACDIGRGEWELKAKFLKVLNQTYPGNVNLVTSVYLDDNWDDALNTDDCQTKLNAAKRDKQVSIPTNGEWSAQITGSISQSRRPHIWFFAISDCDNLLKEKQKLRVEMHLLNSDGSEYSVERKGLDYFYPILLFIYLLTLSGNMIRLIRMFKKTDDLETNLVIFNIAIGSQFSGIFFQIIHYWVYSMNGKGLSVLDFFSQAFELVATMLVTIELILIAGGWTIKDKDFPHPDIYIPVSLLVVLVNLLIIGLGRITDDSYYKYSDYEGIPGYLLIIFRIGMWVWFLYLIKDLYANSNQKIKSFVISFTILGSVYLLALPIVVFISWLFATYLRTKVVIIGLSLIQVSVFFLFTHLFSERSSFYKISTMSQSVLPGKYN